MSPAPAGSLSPFLARSGPNKIVITLEECGMESRSVVLLVPLSLRNKSPW